MRRTSDMQTRKMAELIFALRQKCAQKDLYFLRHSDVSPAEYSCLLQFFGADEVGMKELGERLDITPGGVTRIVTSLEEKGIVERRISSEDRREIRVVLTQTGERLVDKVRRASHDLHAEIIGAIEPRNRDAVILGMEQLVRAISGWLETHREAEHGN
jgi:DNA-binding MarR family transcriptional regulator